MSMSSSSAILGVRLSSVRVGPPPPPQRVGVTIECSSRPQKKATKHHMKTRPRKTNPSDRRHGPPVYPPLPPLPSEWTLIIPSTSHDHDDNNNPSSAQPHQSQ